MKRGEIGRYETTRIAGESVRSFVPHPLPPDPPVVLDASLQQALKAAEAAVANLNQAFDTSTHQRSLRDLLVRQEATASSQIEGIPRFLMEMAKLPDRNLIIWHLCQAAAPKSERSEQNE